MDITLHDSIQQITGKTIIRYRNNSPDSLDQIYMHLYPNAFQVGSVKYREYVGNSGRASRAKYFKDRLEGFTSKIDIHEFSVALPKDGSSWIHKTPILDEYKIDDTILEAKLFEKIPPGKTVRIDIDWTHHVGEMVERAGIYEDQYNMAQWYPKLVVYDQDGWHPDVCRAYRQVDGVRRAGREFRLIRATDCRHDCGLVPRHLAGQRRNGPYPRTRLPHRFPNRPDGIGIAPDLDRTGGDLLIGSTGLTGEI